MSVGVQIVWLLVLALPVACIAWTVTHEELFRIPREYLQQHAYRARNGAVRMFFYLFTCEYCFSHYVAAGVLLLTGYKLLIPGWRGFVLALFSLVWIANIYMSIYGRLRLDIKHEQVAIEADEERVDR